MSIGKHIQSRWFVLLALIFFTACVASTDIRKILTDPRTYEGKQVTVEGEVTSAFSLVVIKYFEINDGTGTLTVVSNKPLPTKGKKIKVTGEVRQAFSLGDKSLTVLIENDPAASKK